MTAGVLGAVLVALALMLMWKRAKWRRTQSVLMLLGSLCLTGGWLAAIRRSLLSAASGAGASATSVTFGVAVPYVVAFVIAVWWALDMDLDGLVARLHKKSKGGGKGGDSNKHKPTWFTPWLGLLVPVSVGLLPYVGSAPDAVRDGLTQLLAAAGS
jgi:4-amino-4-deoxy-L-arabinose transferase-like glycosyltransferase